MTIDLVNSGEEVPMHAYPLDSYALRLFLGRRLAGLRRAGCAVGRVLRRFCAAVRRFNAQQQRLTALQMSAERFVDRPGTAPETYGEFLFRTSGPLMREPSASARRTGQAVR